MDIGPGVNTLGLLRHPKNRVGSNLCSVVKRPAKIYNKIRYRTIIRYYYIQNAS